MKDTLAVSQEPPAEAAPETLPAASRPSRWHVLRAVLGAALAVALLAVVLPRLLGTTAHDVIGAIRAVTLHQFALLTLLWAAGLFVHSFVLTGALPGLTRRRALTLNLTGSAVSNLVPFGGALGMTLNFHMLRTWRVGAREFASFTLVTNIWDVLMKLAMPAVAFGATLAVGLSVSHVLALAALLGVAALLTVLVLVVAALSSGRAAALIARALAATVAGAARLLRRSVDRDAFAAHVVATREEAVLVVRRSWHAMSAAMIGYGLLQAGLLYACLYVVGMRLPLAAVLAAYAVERLLTVVCVTPGAIGVSEAGAAGLLVAFGGDPTAVAAGVLLYRGFVTALEVPVGGMWLAGWFLSRRWAARTLAA
ncbi:MAG: lysylphosphatidylglycerol synthase domain-containing protein [Marmoricola sp.]